MADIRIKDLTTTASSTASDDFIAVDGTTNGTRKLNAFSPTFGGNATVTGTLSTVGNPTFGTSGNTILTLGPTGALYTHYIRSATAGGAIQIQGDPATGNRWVSLGHIDNASSYTEGLKIDSNAIVRATGTTASTSTSSGALVVSGGVGVAGAIYAGGVLSTVSGAGFNTPDWRFYQSGTSGYIRDLVNGQMALQFVSGSASTIQVYATGTQDSTSTTSGAFVSSGGLGVAGAVNAGTFFGLVDGVTAPATAGGYARIYVDSADGDLKVKFGDGTVKTIATDS